MKDITNYGDFFSCYSSQFFPDGKSIQQRLCRMFVRPIACVDDIRLDMFR